MPRRVESAAAATAVTDGDRPGDHLNREGTWSDVLEPAGWTIVYERNDTTYWRRPGKDHGISATTNHAGSDLFYAFSTSTTFKAERGYNKFSVYAILNHDRDYEAAAKALASQQRGHDVDESRPDTLVDPRPLPRLLDEVSRYIRKYVVLTKEQLIATTLWVVHTHAINAFDCTPYLQITSATAETGKTRQLEVQECLVARPWFTQRTSAAVLVRKIDAVRPTLLLDESDAAFSGDREYAEALRGVLNAGYRRSGRASLCVGQGANISYKDFSTFCPKAIAGIGKLPDTVASRSIRIELKRRKKDEVVEKFHAREARPEADSIRVELMAWGKKAVANLRAARPGMPPGLRDRAEDVWEPLLAIADMAGDGWPDLARRAAVSLSGHQEGSDDINVMLLHDIRKVLTKMNATTFISSTELANDLAALDSRPWGDWKRGKPITTRAIADRLKGFGIVPSSNGSARGYHRDRFEDMWTRYPSCLDCEPSNRNATNEHGAEVAISNRQTDGGVDGLEMPIAPIDSGAPDALTGQTKDIREEDEDDAEERDLRF